MPTYEYECEGCRRVFEIRQSISAPALTTCDQCGAPVRRLLSPAPFILKGGGWYVTDYPSESRKKALESEKKSSGEQSSTSTAASGTTSDGSSSNSTSTSSSSAGTSSSSTSDTSTKAAPAAKPATKKGSSADASSSG